MKKGFTLIELSIVLVIVGLLIGGILTAQSLIDSVKISNTVKMLSGYNHAVSLYKDRHKYYPGDNPNAIAHTGADVDGNGDRVIGSNYLANPPEQTYTYHHLIKAGYLSDKKDEIIPGNSPNTGYLEVGRNVMETPFAGVGINFSGQGTRSVAYNTIWPSPRFLLHIGSTPDLGGSFNDTMWGASLNAIQAMSIDKKIDDGKYNSGNFLAMTPQSKSKNNLYTSCTAGAGVYIASEETGCIAWLKFEEFGYY